MPRGRSPRALASVRSLPIRQAVSHVEMLEERRLLTTLTGGQTFDYLDASNNVIRIKLVGNITAEFIGARVRSDHSAFWVNRSTPSMRPILPSLPGICRRAKIARLPPV